MVAALDRLPERLRLAAVGRRRLPGRLWLPKRRRQSGRLWLPVWLPGSLWLPGRLWLPLWLPGRLRMKWCDCGAWGSIAHGGMSASPNTHSMSQT